MLEQRLISFEPNISFEDLTVLVLESPALVQIRLLLHKSYGAVKAVKCFSSSAEARSRDLRGQKTGIRIS